jgi:DNA-binding LacI/PurR family transcriptional regulator
LKKETLYEKIYNDIIEGIKSNQYPPGSRLPSEKELSDSYNVSRITSKKALEMLADQNLIARMPGKGSYVMDDKKGEFSLPEVKNNQRSQKKTIGVIMDAFGASYGYQVLLGIESECKKQQLNFILKCTYGSKEDETEAIDELISNGVAGIIIMCVHDETYNAQVLKLAVENFPIVLIDRQLKGIPIPYVGTNNYKAAKELTDWLFQHGHTNICFVTHSSMQTPTILERQSGFVDSHLEHNILTNESMWITNLCSMLPTTNSSGEIGEEADLNQIKEYILKHPQTTAFFAVEYSIGLLVYKTLLKLGLDKEKKVVFFDGIDEIYDANPIFTRIKQGEFLIGLNSVDLIVKKMKGLVGAEIRLIPYEIIEGKEDFYNYR